MFRSASGVALAMVLPACGVETSLDSPDSSARIRAIQRASASEDESAIPKLICLLGSDDPAVRLLSIRTLERMTGQTLGFDHAAPESNRDDAIKKWEEWYANRDDAKRSAAEPKQAEPNTRRSGYAPPSDLSSDAAAKVDHP